MPPASSPMPDPREKLSKGFFAITVAGTLIASIQCQLLSTTIGMTGNEENVAIRAVNAFWLGGLVFDVLAALFAFLTCRWFERLTDREAKHLENVFSDKDHEKDDTESKPTHDGSQLERPWRTSNTQLFLYTWLGLSLFIPMPLLILGIVCMMGGIYTYIWTQHSVIVASLVTLAGAGTLPFIVGDFFIGRENRERRLNIITRLSEMQGDW